MSSADRPVLEFLEAQLERYLQLSLDAEAANSWSASVKAQDQARQVRQQIDQHKAQTEARELPATPEDHRRLLLVEVRALRAAAEAQQSYVAASALMRLEHTILAGAPEDERDDDLEDMTPEEMVSELAAQVKSLPDLLQVKLLRSLGVEE